MCTLMSSKLIAWILVLGLAQDADGDFSIITINIYADSCVSGQMQVEEQSRGIIRVSELSPGDIIRGITGLDQTSSWCKVEAVNPTTDSDNVTSYDGFTENHMVFENNTVRPYGKKGKVSQSRVYTLATECDAAINVEGRAFTPISTTFCPHELGWSEYLLLMAAIRRVTQRTGFFWYSIDVFHDNQTAKVPYWRDMLHDMCTEMLRCAREGQCQEFENVMEEFVHAHLNKPYMEIVERVFPNIGGDLEKSEAGTVSEVVRPREKSNILLFSVVGCALALLLLIVILAAFMYRRRIVKKKKQIKEPHPTLPAEDVKA